MFSRHNDRSTTEDPRSSPTTSSSMSGVREAVAVPVAADQPTTTSRADESVIGREDRFEGTLKTKKGLRVLGQVEGTIEAATYVHIEDGARVNADLTADEAIIAGLYSGKLTCRQRCEIRSTGQVKGEIETVRLMLHEGGFIDGGLHMQRPEAPDASSSQADTLRSGVPPRTSSVTTPGTQDGSARPTATSGVAGSTR